MNSKEKVVIIYNKIKWSSVDELDVLVQVNSVEQSLMNFGYKVIKLEFSRDVSLFIEKLEMIKPAFVFNLVESFDGNGELLYMAASILEYLKIDYTGGSVENLFITTNKLLTKKYLLASEIKTPNWIEHDSSSGDFVNGKYIIKPVSEEASIGIDGNSVVNTNSMVELQHLLTQKNQLYRKKYFAEKYIHGREFNVSMYGTGKEIIILDPAEIIFLNQDNNKEKILNYESKWFENSNDYKNTVRIFNFSKKDISLLNKIKEISLKCWQTLNLKGYARVDYRIDENNDIWVLEINSNPCISPDSGFVAALENRGTDYNKTIFEIIKYRNRFQKVEYENTNRDKV